MEIKHSKTYRGFGRIDFKDKYNVDCSIQESSLATDNCIWFGCNEANPRHLVPGQGWQPVEMPTEYYASTRMHLSQEQVLELLPILVKFAYTGTL